MALTQEQAVKKLMQTRRAYATLRKSLMAYWTLAECYDTGNQWAYSASEHGRLLVNRLQNIVDPRRNDVRVTMSVIGQHVDRMKALLAPKKVASFCEHSDGAQHNRVAAQLGTRILARWIPTIDGVRVLREVCRTRLVLGTGIIKRTIAATGPGRTLEIEAPEGKANPLKVRNWRYGWVQVFPWEIVRDPSATSVHPGRDENIFSHEKPRSAEWVNRWFGTKIETETKLGDLLDSQNALHAAHGLSTASYYSNSRSPGVIFHEAYFKDPDADPTTEWAWCLMGYTDPSEHKEGEIEPLYFGPNPHYGFPFHMLHYRPTTQGPWSMGIPHLLKPGQDFINLAWTWALRTMQAGAGKWLVQKDTLEKPAEQLSNRIDRPIIWKPSGQNAQEPKFVTPPAMSQTVTQVLATTPGWIKDTLNLSDVQYGRTSSRGESGEAISAKLEAASAPLDDLRAEDDMVVRELLYGSLCDVTDPKRARIDTIRPLAGDDVPESNIVTLLNHPIPESVREIQTVNSQMHPAAPAEVQENAMKLVAGQILNAAEAKLYMIRRGVDISTDMAKSMRKQEAEIQMLLRGEPAMPHVGDKHQWHLQVLSEYLDSPEFMTLPEEVRARVTEHWALHRAQVLQESQIQGLMQPGAGVAPVESMRTGEPRGSVPGSVLGGASGGPATASVEAATAEM